MPVSRTAIVISTCAFGAPVGRRADFHFALLREFHRVGHQVPDQLPQPQSIADHGIRKIAIEIMPQTHILRFGFESKLRNHAGQRLAQRNTPLLPGGGDWRKERRIRAWH